MLFEFFSIMTVKLPSTYYFKIEGNDTIFIGDISLSDHFPLAKVGDNVTVEFVNSKDNSEVISSIKFN